MYSLCHNMAYRTKPRIRRYGGGVHAAVFLEMPEEMYFAIQARAKLHFGSTASEIRRLLQTALDVTENLEKKLRS